MVLNEVNHLHAVRDSGATPTPVSLSTAGRALRFAIKKQERLAAGVAMIAGFVDAYGIVTYGTYLSFMSGNTTQTGYRIGQGNLAAAVTSVLPIAFFFIGSFAGAGVRKTHARCSQQ